jgi:hypothetical protein
VFVALLAAAQLGCATLGLGRESAPCSDVFAEPARLIERAKAAGEQQNWPLAYRYAALVHLLHPTSPQDREAFPLAAYLYRKSWAPHRTELDSIWTTSEPVFLFGWLGSFFQDAQEFPQEQMNALFLGMNYGFLRDFLAYGKTRPHVARWTITAEKDNGLVDSVTGAATGAN